MKYHLEFKLDGLPPTLNRLNSMHYMAKARLNRDWRDAVMCAVGANIPKTPLNQAIVKITRYSSTEPDGDNTTAAYKLGRLRNLGTSMVKISTSMLKMRHT